MTDAANSCPLPHAFPSTRWSLVVDALEAGTPGGRDALEALMRRYVPALRVFLLLDRRLASDEADDLLQAFVSSKIIEQNLLSRADRGRGRFRTFLLAALRNYLVDWRRAQSSRRNRPAGGAVASLEALRERPGRADVPSAAPGPTDGFDVEWARQTLADGVRRMRQECETSGRPELWGLFELRVLGPSLEGATPPPYEEVVRRFGFQTPAQASNALTTTKRMFVRILRCLVGEYAESEREIDEEIDDLKAVLARAGAAQGRRERSS